VSRETHGQRPLQRLPVGLGWLTRDQPAGRYGTVPEVRLPLLNRPFRPDGSDVEPRSVPAFLSPEDVAWRRWLLGHQLSFCVWRLLSEQLTSIVRARRPRSEGIAGGVAMYHAYSVLLLYSGSCPPEVYLRTIRPAMAAADPAFSGRWARDYESIPLLLRTIRQIHPTRFTGDLLAAARANQLVHMAVGRRLVSEGPSLLRGSNREGQPVTDRERDIFDAFFRVRRVDTSRSVFIGQLLALAGQVTDDLAERPLVEPDATWGLPAGHTDVVVGFQRDADAILRDLRPLTLEGGSTGD
jgi:hypothetical protein